MFTAEKLSKFADTAFAAASDDVHSAARALMPHSDPAPGMSRAAHIQAVGGEEYDNYILYHDLIARTAVRVGGVGNSVQVELATRQFKARHPYVFDHVHELEDEPRAQREDDIARTALHAVFRNRLARDAAELMVPGIFPSSLKPRLSYLQDQFTNLAGQANAAFELNGMVHLYPFAAMAKTATPFRRKSFKLGEL